MKWALLLCLATAGCQQGSTNAEPSAAAPSASAGGTQIISLPKATITDAYKTDISNLCDAVQLSGAMDKPKDERWTVIAMWPGPHIKTEDGREFGFELVFFKRRTDLDRFSVVPVRLLGNPYYFAHFAITDKGENIPRGGGLLALHAHRQRLDAAAGQPGVHGRHEAAEAPGHAARLVDEDLGAEDDAAGEIVVAAEELGGRVEDHVGALGERPGDHRRRKGRVHRKAHAARAAPARTPAHVGPAPQRVGVRLGD